jgi:hypothetical protein
MKGGDSITFLEFKDVLSNGFDNSGDIIAGVMWWCALRDLPVLGVGTCTSLELLQAIMIKSTYPLYTTFIRTSSAFISGIGESTMLTCGPFATIASFMLYILQGCDDW